MQLLDCGSVSSVGYRRRTYPAVRCLPWLFIDKRAYEVTIEAGQIMLHRK